jgi:ADP-ribose pyrophosphatase YjhB (NUDIX family)
MLKSFIDKWDDLMTSFNSRFGKTYKGTPEMEPVPEKAKKDPMEFFKFWEKRFHERGEEFMRKLYKVSAHFQGEDPLQKKLTESDFDWFERDSKQTSDTAKLFQDKIDLLKSIYEPHGFEVVYRHGYQHSADILKDGGQYSTLALHDYPINWYSRLRTDYREAVHICGEDCDLSLVFKDIHNIMVQYINDNDLGATTIGAKPRPYRLIESIDDLDWIKDETPNEEYLEQEFHKWMVDGLTGSDEIFAYYVTAKELIKSDLPKNILLSVRQRILVDKEEPSKVFCEVLSNNHLNYPSTNIICKDAKRKRPSFLKRMFNIKESEEDFDWMGGNPILDFKDLEEGNTYEWVMDNKTIEKGMVRDWMYSYDGNKFRVEDITYGEIAPTISDSRFGNITFTNLKSGKTYTVSIQSNLFRYMKFREVDELNESEDLVNEDFYYKGVNPTVDLVVVRGNEILLIKRSNNSEAEPGKWALPGGFHDSNANRGEEWVENKETALEAAKREVREETGLDVDNIKGLDFQLVGVFEGEGRDPRDREDSWTRSTAYMVSIPEEEGGNIRGMDDADRAEWVQLDSVFKRDLAFDHKEIISKALRLRNINESEDFDWIGTTEDSPFEELKGELYNKYPEIEIEEDLDHGILRITNAVYKDIDTITEHGFAFGINRVLKYDEKGDKIIYNVGEYTEIWWQDGLGEKGELVDSDLSFSALGNIDEVMAYLNSSSIGRDGRPYSDMMSESEGDFDWISDTPENPLSISDVPQKIWMLDLTREEQKKIYDYLISLGFKRNISISSLVGFEGEQYRQKLGVLILNTDNRVYFGDDEVEALERGEEKPRPKGALGHLPFYTYGTEEQKKKQLENLKNSWDNTYGSYLEIDTRVLLDLIKNNSLTESEGDFDWISDIPTLDIRPGHVIDVKNSLTPPEEILKGLCREGYEWIRGDKICDENGEIIDIFSEWNRTIEKDLNFIVIGYAQPEDDDWDPLPAKQILYTEHQFQAERWGPTYTV